MLTRHYHRISLPFCHPPPKHPQQNTLVVTEDSPVMVAGQAAGPLSWAPSLSQPKQCNNPTADTPTLGRTQPSAGSGKERKGKEREEETPLPPKPSSVRRTLQGRARNRLCLGTCVQTPLPPLLPCLPPFSLLRSLLCHSLSLGKWRPLSPPSHCTGLTRPAWQGQGYQGEAKQPPFCLWAESAVRARRALSVHFATALCALRRTVRVWARPRHQTAAGAGQGGCEAAWREVGQRRRGGCSWGWCRGRSAAPEAQTAGEGQGRRPRLLWDRTRAGGCLSQNCILWGRNAKTPSPAALPPTSGFLLATVVTLSIPILYETRPEE